MNIEEALISYPFYQKQKDNLIRFIFYSVIVFIYIDGVRQQISEINLLQLVPGIYLILLFTSFILLIIWSSFISNNLYDVDYISLSGTKTLERMGSKIVLKTRILLGLLVASLTLNSVLPLSLDSFISYGENEIENLWSFDEVINLELLLLLILIILSQIPIYGFSQSNTEKSVLILPRYWKIISFIIFLASGLITPTIDGYTQFLFSFSAISLCLFVITSIKQRLIVNDQGLNGYIS
jgi:hypothetical protein